MIEHLRGRDRKLEPLGWTGPDAEWIALVCLHSGVFTRGQFCHYFGDAHRWTAARFVQTLIERKAAVESDVIALTESRIIYCQSRQREDCFQKAVIKRGLRRIRRSALRARSSSSQ